MQTLSMQCLVLKKDSGPKRLYSHDICLQVKTVWNVSRREALRYSRLLTQSSARETVQDTACSQIPVH